METQSWFWGFILLFFFFFSSSTNLCSAADTLSSGQSLYQNQSQTLVSAKGDFELGFYKPGPKPNYYIAIWYKKISIANKIAVWVANRDDPFTDPSSELKLLESGNLVILNQSKTPVWSTNLTSKGTNSSELVLRDDGNLILRDGSNSSLVLWQSFDHPTDTWLPGGKLRYDNKTKLPTLLTSWKNSEDPAQGMFNLQFDPIGEQYVIFWNRSVRYWSSGPWDGQIFSLVPEVKAYINNDLSSIFNFTYITNEEETYFSYNVHNSSIVTRFVMSLSGQVTQVTWLENSQSWNLFLAEPRQRCEVHALCGTFSMCSESLPICQCLPGFEPRSLKDWNLRDSSGGCVKTISSKCGDKEGFWRMANMKLPDNGVSLNVDSEKQCESACLSNCSCQAYNYRSGCSIWSADLLNTRQLSAPGSEGRDLYLRLADSEIRRLRDMKSSTTVIIVGVVAGIVVSLGLVLLLIWNWRRRSVGKSKTVEGSLVAFTYRDLQIATKNFSEKLGGGGFGSVFKGIYGSNVIAVKKLEGVGQGEKQFRSEVSTIGTIQHVNLVRLRGFSSEGAKRLLVYDCMPNGSLDAHLFHAKISKILDWKTRYQIALGTARGLAYLHEKCRDCIIHCDIKPENILLDTEFCPKVADFGLAKLIGRDFSRVLTTMRGTRGYLAPEWISGVAITAKADVYSYGMMLFEIISGRRNTEESEDGRLMFFPTWAANKMAEGEEVLSLLDYRLEGEGDVDELTKAFRVACWCIQDDETHRPAMGQVVQILEGILEVNPSPIPRTLQVLVENEMQIHFFSESSSNPSSQTQTNTSTTSSGTKSSTSYASSKP